MTRWLGLVIVILLVGFAYYVIKDNVRFTPDYMKPKFADITRGDIRVPISASGLIEPKQRIEVKSKASGEIIDVAVEPGDFVRKGDTLITLQQDEEQRNFDRAEADLMRSEALLAQARLAKQQAEVNKASAEARYEQLVAQGSLRKFDLERKQQMSETTGQTSEYELVAAQASYDMNTAEQRSAEAAIRQAQITIDDAEQAIKINEANVRVATATLGDASERLDDTVVKAEHDAIVTAVNVSIGEVIQGGEATFTGGTVLAELADISKLKVVARVDEAEYGRVMAISPLDALPEMGALREKAAAGAEEIAERSGKVTLTVDAFPEQTFTGRIERVEPQGRLNAGSSVIQYDVHVAITDDKRYRLLLGSQAQVEFTVDSALGVLRVPAEAVKSEGSQKGLFLRVDPPAGSDEQWGRRFIPAQFGITDGTYTEVVRALGDATLESGQTVYTKLPLTPGDGD